MVELYAPPVGEGWSYLDAIDDVEGLVNSRGRKKIALSDMMDAPAPGLGRWFRD